MTFEGTAEGDVGRVAAPAKLENRTLWQRVHEHLREEILAGRLPAGSELQEVGLSRELGVSRGPIREALGRLAAEGLVTVRPRRGAVVRALSEEEFLWAYQVREALEVMAVRLAVPQLTADDLGRLQRLIDEMTAHADAGAIGAFFDANSAFHHTFFDAARNPMLTEIYRQVCGQIDRYRLRSLELRGDLHRSIAEHKALLRAAKGRDADKASHLIAEHIRVPQIRLRVEEHEAAKEAR